jgi:hypothetical protein
MFRKGKERALQREVEVAYGSDGQPQGLWLGDVTVPAAVTLSGTAAADDGATLADNGLAVDEVSGAVVPIWGGSSCGFTFEGLSVGPHRIRIFIRDEAGHDYVGGPAEVNILPAEAGTEKSLTRFALHRAGPPAETGLVKLKFGVAGSIPGLKLSDLRLEGLPGTVGFGSDGVAQVDLPEGLFTVEVKLPAGLPVGVTPPPRKTFVAIRGQVLDLGTLYAVSDPAQDQALLSCRSDADCAPGSCTASHVCQGYTPPQQAPASVPWCDAGARGCTIGPYGGVYTGTGPTGYGPPYTATCLGYGSGASVAVTCGTTCTPDGLAVVEATLASPGCQPVVPLQVTPQHGYTAGSCNDGDFITFTASGGTPPYAWPTWFNVAADGTTATADYCDAGHADYHEWVYDAASPRQEFQLTVTVKPAPYVVNQGPYFGESGVPVTSSIFADFSEPLAPSSVNAASLRLIAGGVAVDGTVSLDTAGTRITFTPAAPLPTGAFVNVDLAMDVTDLFGVPMSSNGSWYFTTWAPATTKALTAISLTDGAIAAVAGTIDEVAKTISVTLPAGTPVTALVASFTSTGVGVAVGTTPQVSGSTANDFTSPVTYVVKAEDNTTASYVVTVTVAPAAPGFTATSSLATGRYYHTATLLQDGKVLVAGGLYTGGVLASAELYDPALGTWSPTGSMFSARSRHTATLLPSGKVLVTGGEVLSSVELYDPTTGTWSEVAFMGAARAYHTATLLPSGLVLVAGGITSTTPRGDAELYDPSAGTLGTWTATGTMGFQRAQFTATLLPGGKVLATGNGGGGANTAERFDPATGNWTPTGSLTVGVYDHTATLLADGKVLVRGAQTSGQLFDPLAGSWSSTTGLSITVPWSHTATLLASGTVLVTGGATASVVYRDAELYDPSSQTWTPTGQMSVPRKWHTATLLNDGSVLVVGGNAGGPSGMPNVERYLP